MMCNSSLIRMPIIIILVLLIRFCFPVRWATVLWYARISANGKRDERFSFFFSFRFRINFIPSTCWNSFLLILLHCSFFFSPMDPQSAFISTHCIYIIFGIHTTYMYIRHWKQTNRGIWKGVHRSFGIFTLFLHLQTNEAHQFAYSWLLLPINTHQKSEKKTNNIRKRYVWSLIWVQKIIRIRSRNEPCVVCSNTFFSLQSSSCSISSFHLAAPFDGSSLTHWAHNNGKITTWMLDTLLTTSKLSTVISFTSHNWRVEELYAVTQLQSQPL